MYSPRLTELFHSRAHGGNLPGTTHLGTGGVPGQGPYIRLSFRMQDGAVQEARWKTYGCPAAMACAEAVCGWAEGKAADLLCSVTPEQVTEWVGGVPEGKEHCPELAAAACRAVSPITG